MSASSTLIAHKDAREVSRTELGAFKLPESTRSYHPISHDRVLETAQTALTEAGYRIHTTRMAVSADGSKFFGTLDLAAPLSPDGLAIIYLTQ